MIVNSLIQLKAQLQALQNSGLSVDQIQRQSTQDVNFIFTEFKSVSEAGFMPGNQPILRLLSVYQR